MSFKSQFLSIGLRLPLEHVLGNLHPMWVLIREVQIHSIDLRTIGALEIYVLCSYKCVHEYRSFLCFSEGLGQGRF